MERKNWLRALLLLLAVILALSACAPAGGEDPGVTTLIYANLTEGGVDTRAVNKFNSTHKKRGIRIEVRNYFDEDGRSGKDRLLTEMVAGKVPDIIDLGDSSYGLPYQQLARKGYLEDLRPYIENDPNLGREGVWEAPLKAVEVDGGLYTIFKGVSIHTLVGAESLVGDRYSWTLADLQEAFSHMPEDSTVLNFYFTKSDIFYYVFNMSINSYVDWETGTNRFDSEQFRAALEFVDSFPAEFHGFDFENGEARVQEEWMDRVLDGQQMLLIQNILRACDIQSMDKFWGKGGRAAYIGYPTEDGSAGSFFTIKGGKLAMSADCQNKEAAWEFLRQIILPRLHSDTAFISGYLPINRTDYDMVKQTELRPPSGESRISTPLGHDGPIIKISRVKAEEMERFEEFISQIEKIDLYDSILYDIVWETCGPYFAGDKTLDETVQMLNNRVGLYLNEQR